MLSNNDNPYTLPPLTYLSILHPKIYSHTKPAASSHRQLFSASSVNVRSKVHIEIMELATFFSVSRRYCSRGIGVFWMRGCTEEGWVKQSPEGEGEMSQSLLEQVLAWTSTFPSVRFLGKKKKKKHSHWIMASHQGMGTWTLNEMRRKTK